MAGSRHSGLFARLNVPEPRVLERALAAIVAAGPHTRLGLVPDPDNRRWTYDPDTRVPLRPLPDDVVQAGSAAILEHIRRVPVNPRPFEVHYSREHLAFDIDHGVGDGHFAHDVVNALFDVCRGRASRWVSRGDTRLAVPRALVHTFARHPRRARTAVQFAGELRSLRSSRLASAPSIESVDWTPSYAAAVGHVNAGAESAVEEWRRSQPHKSSGAATWLYIARQALHGAGIPMTGTVMLPFGCRRYLPEGASANGNFMVGLDFPIALDETTSVVAQRLRDYTTSTVSMIGLGAVSGLALVPSHRSRVVPSTRSVDPVGRITYSDMGIVTALDNLPWLNATDRYHIGFMDPSTPEGISVLSIRVGPTRKIVISFHDNVFARPVIDEVVDSMTNPMQFLQ